MQWRTYAQLIRLPNVFTAVSDVLLGTLAAGSWRDQPGQSAALLAASIMLYSAGMVWNDYFDIEVDRHERPFRPLPSGRVSLRSARRLGTALVVLGALFAALSGWQSKRWNTEPILLAGLLIIAILVYDGWLKKYTVGPVIMGLCRFLNILMATSLAGSNLAVAERFHLATVIGTYIVGVTWFARNEAGHSSLIQLRAAMLTIIIAIFLGLSIALHRPTGSVPIIYPYLIATFLIVILVPLVRASRRPDPKSVQKAVKYSILGLIIFDAVIATLYVGPLGLLLLLLLIPALFLGRVFYST